MYMDIRMKTFFDESTFNSANNGLLVVYRSWEDHYNFQYVSVSTNSGCFFFVEGRILHCIETHLGGLQHKHILKTTMVTDVRLLYPNTVMQFQQDHSYSHDSRFKNVYCYRSMLNPVTGHHKHLH